MRILIVPGWLMNEKSFSATEKKLTKLGHKVTVFKCPGVSTDEEIELKNVLTLLRDTLEDNEFDVIISHSYAVNWLLQMKNLLQDKKLVLLSPCYKNLRTVWEFGKYFTYPILASRKFNLPEPLIYKGYKFIHASGQLTCKDMVDGYFTCNAKTASRLLPQTLKLKHSIDEKIKSNTLIVYGIHDPLIKCKFVDLLKVFEKYNIIKLNCGHDTFNYMPSEVIRFMET